MLLVGINAFCIETWIKFYIANLFISRTTFGNYGAAHYGLRKMLNWIKDNYDNIPVYVTENGYPDDTGTLNDFSRVEVLSGYISEVLKGTCSLTSLGSWYADIYSSSTLE